MKYWTIGVLIGTGVSMMAACSSDPAAPVDRSMDAGSMIQDMEVLAPEDMPTTQDLSMPQPDMMTVQDMPRDEGGNEPDMSSPDAGDLAQDMEAPDMNAPDMDALEDAGMDMAVEDMGQDMSVDMGEYADRARGDCTQTSDCGSADLFCERGAVGGTCSGPCPACDDIPGPNTYQCIAGACVPECSDDTDCPPGRSCNMRRGVCQVERCTNNVCPVPWFACSEPDGICVRQPCDQGEVCPAQTMCDGRYCIENHSMR